MIKMFEDYFKKQELILETEMSSYLYKLPWMISVLGQNNAKWRHAIFKGLRI